MKRRYTVATCALVAFGLTALWYLNPGKGDAQLVVEWEGNDWTTETFINPQDAREDTIWSRKLTFKNMGKVPCSLARFYSQTAKPSVLDLEGMAEQAASDPSLSPGEEVSTKFQIAADPPDDHFLIVFTRSPTDLAERLARRKRHPWLKPIFPLPYTVIEIPPIGHPAGLAK